MRDILESERVILRSFNANDARDMFEYLSLEEVVKYEPYTVMSYDDCKKEARNRSNNPSFYAAVLKSENKLIGSIYFNHKQPYKYLTYELGYAFNPVYWNRGYATEAAQIIVRYGFNKLGAHRIIANCNQENQRSIKLLERLGMRRESDLKKDIFFSYSSLGEPNWVDSYMYAILREEYLNRT